MNGEIEMDSVIHQKYVDSFISMFEKADIKERGNNVMIVGGGDYQLCYSALVPYYNPKGINRLSIDIIDPYATFLWNFLQGIPYLDDVDKIKNTRVVSVNKKFSDFYKSTIPNGNLCEYYNLIVVDVSDPSEKYSKNSNECYTGTFPMQLRDMLAPNGAVAVYIPYDQLEKTLYQYLNLARFTLKYLTIHHNMFTPGETTYIGLFT